MELDVQGTFSNLFFAHSEYAICISKTFIFQILL